ncbi:MAG: oxygen-independent coproporphyrinogen III oxidase [Alphaproteobacteria bacterium]|nr:oxygen-independent coproporphyrinogen III oxidase [Alphaproteobacteria bacterium]
MNMTLIQSRILDSHARNVPRYTSYPTAPHFHDGVDEAVYRRWLAELPDDASLSLYVHVPYCDRLCWFCGCHTKIVARYQPISDYLEVLQREIATVARLVTGEQRVRHIHWGGGTPVILRPEDISGLAGRLRDGFEVAPEAEFAVEIDPREFDAPRAEALARTGVNRASLGVQDLNPEIQEAINRVQPLAVTAGVVEMLRGAGIERLNLDLMYGLPHQTVERVLASVDGILELAPSRVALFGYAHVPWMKRHQRLIDDEALPGPRARLQQFLAASERLTAAGYEAIGLDHFARADDTLAVAARQGRMHRNFQGYTEDDATALIGFGASAIGELPQGYAQNAAPIHDYKRRIGAGRLATVRGIAVTPEDRIRRAVIERLMCDLAVDLADICDRHDRPVESFDDEIELMRAFARDGLVSLEGRAIRVHEEARPLLRSICAAFDHRLREGPGRHSSAV